MKIITKNIPVIRFALFAAALAGCLFLTPTVVHAAKSISRVTPESLQADGFSIQIEDQKDGTVQFRLTRDLSKARLFPQDSGLRVSRYATLRVVGKSGLLAECEVGPNSRQQQSTVTYRFTLARDCVAHSSFTLAEDDDYQDQTREHLIGGGTHFEFDLALFAKHQPEDKAQ
jgi:hypothetical protein